VHTAGIKKDRGHDQSTQIMENDPYLFDFDNEVGPIVRVLVNRTLEQARMEVLEEEELMLLSREKSILDGDKKRLINEIQRITIKEYRLKAERQRRKNQMILSKEAKDAGQKKIVCRKVSQMIVKKLFQQRIHNLHRVGFFEGGREKSIRKLFLKKVISTSENRVVQSTEMQYLMNKMFFDASQILQRMHLEAITKKKRNDSFVKMKSIAMEISQKTKITTEMSQSQEMGELVKKYVQKDRVASGMIIGDSFNLFTMHIRDLKSSEKLTPEVIERIKTKTKVMNQMESSKAKAFSRNPKNFGKACFSF
jgi:hypothetical protein